MLVKVQHSCSQHHLLVGRESNGASLREQERIALAAPDTIRPELACRPGKTSSPYLTQSAFAVFCTCQLPQKFVNVSFAMTDTNSKLTGLSAK